MRLIAASGLLLAVTLAACTASQQRQTQDQARQAYSSAPAAVKNGVVTAAVAAKLAGVNVDSATNVNVSAESGAITLTGKARTPAEAAQYAAAAKSVDGVTSVRNLLSIDPHLSGVKEQAADASLEIRISAAIGAQAGLNAFHITPLARGSVVTLTGSVPSSSIAQTVLETVRGVPGVRTVRDHIAIQR